MSDLWKCLNSSLGITSWEKPDIFLGFIILSENYPELALIDMNKNQRSRRRRLLSVYSALAAVFWAGNVVLHCFFPRKKKWVLQRIVHGQFSLFSLLSVTAVTEHSLSKVLWRTVQVPLKELFYSGSGKGSPSSKIVQFCCWPLGDFTLNVNRTSGRKMKNPVEIV